MIEFRWLSIEHPQPGAIATSVRRWAKLQFRVRLHVKGLPMNVVWGDWQDIPVVPA